MGFFKKKEREGLPDLPVQREQDRKFDFGVLPELDVEDNEESHILPTFPDSPTHNKFSQAVIKDAVGHNGENASPQDSHDDKNVRIVEMEEWTPSENIAETYNPGFEKAVPAESFSEKKFTSGAKNSDVFVKIDKFRSAKKALDEINEKLEEISDMIKRIRETKLREDQELSIWERDIAHVGARIQGVNENIFEKVE